MVQSLQLIEVLSRFGSVGGESEREKRLRQHTFFCCKNGRKFHGRLLKFNGRLLKYS